MFLVNEILVFSPGRRQEALDRLSYIHGLMAPQEGFVNAIVAKYLGDLTRHTVLRFWQDEAAYQKFREGPDGNYGRNRPQGLYTNEQVIPQWNSFSVDGDIAGGGNYLAKVHQPVPEDGWAGFQQMQGQISAVAKSAGMKSAAHFRAKDRSEALTVARFGGRQDLEKMFESPDFAKIAGPRMAEGATPPKVECFEIVTEVGPKG